ncbi:RodZ domain-containing protein [Rheinheimera sp.]|uniref:RodZ domain-containing protein n=1 Tax=Rheinheimera sp. TaxID=1869214 RepID=UPI00260CAA3D|nr:RodZ domain-containing protein [Rheinheimera sp.]MCA1928922.1 DUF4115 domain-containing protein [Rheinheimera sp.]
MTTELTQPTLSAGQTLRQAREQQDLSVAQVAQQLNLSKGLIEDLEQDRVDAKLSSTFVRGYLRSYAKLLKIPAQQVLDAYSSNSKGLHQVPSLTRSFSKRTATEATENRFMWVTYFVIFVFIVLLVVGFWQSRFGSSSASTALPMAQTDESMLETASVQPAAANAQPGQAPLYQQSTQPHNEIPVTQLDHSPTATESPTSPSAAVADSAHVETVQQQATVDATQDTAGSAPLSEQSAAEPAVASAENLSGPQSPVVQTTEPQTEPSVEQPVTPTAETPVLTPTVTTPDPQSTVQAETNATISLSLSAECWVDVVDATGKRLVFGSRQAGEQLNLRGVAPVKVLLGNAAAATLSFNGEAIDLSGYPTGRVARLTLGQN